MRVAVVIERVEDLDDLSTRFPDALLELRVDQDLLLLERAEDFAHRCILTLRSKREGGGFSGKRYPLLRQMISKHPLFVDLELVTDSELLPDIDPNSVILSMHDYSSSMEVAARNYLGNLKELGVIKSGVLHKFVGKSIDTIDALRAYQIISTSLEKFTVLSIERNGDMLRLLPEQYSQSIVYGSTTHGFLVPIESVLNPPSFRTGLLGKNLSHSLSPLIHRIFWEQHNLNGYYFLLEASDEERTRELISQLKGFKGINITYPYKALAAKMCDNRDEVVLETGSCNTIVFGDKLSGSNTDVFGIRRSLEELDVTGGSAMIYGAGDSARSVLSVLSSSFDVTVVYRSSKRLANLRGVHVLPMDSVNSTDGYILFVNATPLGLRGELPPIKIETGTKVFDLVYSKDDTPLVRKYGGIDGKLMLFYQAVAAFERFSGLDVNISDAYELYRRRLNA